MSTDLHRSAVAAVVGLFLAVALVGGVIGRATVTAPATASSSPAPAALAAAREAGRRSMSGAVAAAEREAVARTRKAERRIAAKKLATVRKSRSTWRDRARRAARRR